MSRSLMAQITETERGMMRHAVREYWYKVHASGPHTIKDYDWWLESFNRWRLCDALEYVMQNNLYPIWAPYQQEWEEFHQAIACGFPQHSLRMGTVIAPKKKTEWERMSDFFFGRRKRRG